MQQLPTLLAQQCWELLPLFHVDKSLTGFKLCATELPTTRNNMQQGVQMDTTDNIQQCWVRLHGVYSLLCCKFYK